MKQTYLGTTLDGPDYHEFGILAATKGTSKSALLKSLTLDFIARHQASIKAAGVKSRPQRTKVIKQPAKKKVGAA